MELSQIYRARFESTGLEKRSRVWRILCSEYFQQYVPADAAILDLGCGYGEFINNIGARSRYGIDLNSDSRKFLADDISFRLTSADDLSHLDSGSMDRVFTSNFLEHLETKEVCTKVFREVYRVLKPSGKFMILGPNIRYAYKEYWDYFDHHLPLSHLSLAEGLSAVGFHPETVIDRFLPYTMNNSRPTADWIIKFYLSLPIAWKLFGKQFFVVARK
jgi:SAM-dependent methyltransferase